MSLASSGRQGASMCCRSLRRKCGARFHRCQALPRSEPTLHCSLDKPNMAFQVMQEQLREYLMAQGLNIAVLERCASPHAASFSVMASSASPACCCRSSLVQQQSASAADNPHAFSAVRSNSQNQQILPAFLLLQVHCGTAAERYCCGGPACPQRLP